MVEWAAMGGAGSGRTTLDLMYSRYMLYRHKRVELLLDELSFGMQHMRHLVYPLMYNAHWLAAKVKTSIFRKFFYAFWSRTYCFNGKFDGAAFLQCCMGRRGG